MDDAAARKKKRKQQAKIRRYMQLVDELQRLNDVEHRRYLSTREVRMREVCTKERDALRHQLPREWRQSTDKPRSSAYYAARNPIKYVREISGGLPGTNRRH